MINAWWLCLIIPISICAGLLIASFMRGAFTEENKIGFDESEIYN